MSMFLLCRNIIIVKSYAKGCRNINIPRNQGATDIECQKSLKLILTSHIWEWPRFRGRLRWGAPSSVRCPSRLFVDRRPLYFTINWRGMGGGDMSTEPFLGKVRHGATVSENQWRFHRGHFWTGKCSWPDQDLNLGWLLGSKACLPLHHQCPEFGSATMLLFS